jgi:hypothetical protein
VGHIKLSEADIEFVQNEEIVLDESDVVVLSDSRRARVRPMQWRDPSVRPQAVRPQVQRAVAQPAANPRQMPAPRRAALRALPFDDAPTRIWAIPAGWREAARL